MKKWMRFLSALCVVCMLCGCSGVGAVLPKDVLTDADAFRVMSFNVCGWNYKNLKHLAAKTILAYDPDIVGLQECTYACYQGLMKDLVGYGFVGVGRENGKLDKNSGESCGILYKTEKFTLLDSGTFWLSETPEIPGKGWDADYVRICTWALFRDKTTGQEFVHVNTHLENIDDGTGMEALEKGTRMVIDKALSFDGPVIMTGDFNFEKETPYYSAVLEAGFRDAQAVAIQTMEGPTYHGDPAEHIDYVFLNADIARVEVYKLVEDTYESVYPSDHYPIYVDLKF